MGISNFKGMRKCNLTVFTEGESAIMRDSPDFLPPKHIFSMATVIVFSLYCILKVITIFEFLT